MILENMQEERPEWINYHEGNFEIKDSRIILRSSQSGPPAIAKLAYAGCSTRKKLFNPGLKGTNSIEATLLDYGAEGNYLVKEGKIMEFEDPSGKSFRSVAGNYQRGWGISISNYHYLVTSKKETDRGVQVHFDWWSNLGLTFWLVRDVLPEDKEKYPSWVPHRQTPEEVFEMGKKGPVITPVVNKLGMRWFPPTDKMKTPVGHRYGLVLTDDGNTVYWTLDGNEIDRADITGFFSSHPDSVKDGAFATMGGNGSYERNHWSAGDVSIRHSTS